MATTHSPPLQRRSSRIATSFRLPGTGTRSSISNRIRLPIFARATISSYSIDAETGNPLWTHQMKGEVWGSALVADGKVYVGSKGGEFCILAAGKEKKVLATVDLGTACNGTPVAANGVLYITGANTLYAVQAPAKAAAK